MGIISIKQLSMRVGTCPCCEMGRLRIEVTPTSVRIECQACKELWTGYNVAAEGRNGD